MPRLLLKFSGFCFARTLLPAAARLLSLAVLGAFGSYCCGDSVTVDLNTRYQSFEGWGTSLAWWGNVIGGFPDPMRAAYVSAFFDPVTGLGLNIVRYNIGGGENPAYLPPNTPVYIQYRARIPGFEPSPNVYDWTQDANQVWVLQQAIQQGVTISEAFSNSPPWWMTNSGSVTGAVGAGDNLNPSYTSAFADYLTTVVQHFHDDLGITFRSLEPFNEPNSGYWHFGNNQEGCGFVPTTQDNFIKVLTTSLASKGINYTGISASDETNISEAVATFNALLPDSSVIGDISQVNTHAYSGTTAAKVALNAAATAANKRLWMSEYGDGTASGLTMASEIVSDLKNLQPNAWVTWQAVDNSGGWGFFLNPLSDETSTSYTVNQKYYVMAQFSRFIRPGYQFVGVNDTNSIAAYDRSGTAAIVTVVPGSSARMVTYSLQNFGSGPWQVTPYQTSANTTPVEHLAQLSSFIASGANFTVTLPRSSVTTFVLTNGQSSPLVSGAIYHIKNVNSELLLEDPGSSITSGAPLDQSSGNGGNNQNWIATAAGSNWVFTNVASGLALDIANFSSSPGSVADQATVTHNKNQVWALASNGKGSYTITNQNSGLNLDVAGESTSSGGQIIQMPAGDGSGQSWTFDTPLVQNVNLVTTAVLSKQSDGSYMATVTVSNNGPTTIQDVQLTGASLGSAVGLSIPQLLGNITAGASAVVGLTFPANAGSSGALSVEKYAGTYLGGTFGGSLRATLP